ncbi:MAG: YkgJ family cysteine cluster protein [Desulfomonilaceae bacterium]
MIDKNERQEWDFFSTTLIEEARTAIWQTRARIEPRDLIERVKAELQEIAHAQQSEDSDQLVWDRVRQALVSAAYQTRPYCLRCGTCCKEDTPTLVRDDMGLLRQEILRPEHLYTIREGEIAFNPFEDKAAPLSHEIIKVRSVSGTRRCIFFRGLDGLCSIYENRPLQCRLQECWNPERMAELPSEYIAREDIFRQVQPLWDIISAHEERCSFEKWSEALERLEASRGHNVEEVLELLRYDHGARQFLMETFSMASEVVDLILGKPLKDFLSFWGLELVETSDGGFMLQPARKNG